MTTSLLLASASPRRRELLARLGLPFEARATDVDETLLPGAPPTSEAGRLAVLKATAGGDGPAAIGADTLVVLDGRPLGKPTDEESARSILRALRQRDHEVVTGVAVRNAGRVVSETTTTRVWMRAYSDAEIAAFVASGAAADKAGAYAIQDPLFRPVERITGCYCNVVGLPLGSLTRLLRAAGCDDLGFQRPELCQPCPDWE